LDYRKIKELKNQKKLEDQLNLKKSCNPLIQSDLPLKKFIQQFVNNHHLAVPENCSSYAAAHAAFVENSPTDRYPRWSNLCAATRHFLLIHDANLVFRLNMRAHPWSCRVCDACDYATTMHLTTA
jgi:hypothetical protein